MSSSEHELYRVMGFTLCVMMAVTLWMAYDAGQIREQAIERGHASYCNDGEFAWVDDCPDEQEQRSRYASKFYREQ